MTEWEPFYGGKSIGKKGSECGVIVLDEEHVLGARITLERNGDVAPWSITCGVYGGFLHTAFASTEDEGHEKYDGIKKLISKLFKEQDSDSRYQIMNQIADSY